MDYQEKYEALKKAYEEMEKAFDEYRLKVAKITFAAFDDVQEEKHGITLRDVYEQLGIEVNEFAHPEVNFDEVLWEDEIAMKKIQDPYGNTHMVAVKFNGELV